MIKPTVGRVVWFWPKKLGEDAALAHNKEQPLAATVAYVHSDKCVNLTVHDHNGNTHARTSIELIQEGEDAPENGNYCEWMPYQKGQAAKTEQAEAALERAKPEVAAQKQQQAEEALESRAANREGGPEEKNLQQ